MGVSKAHATDHWPQTSKTQTSQEKADLENADLENFVCVLD